jgi:hypothetical protein
MLAEEIVETIPARSVEAIIRGIDDRVEWIIRGLGQFIHKEGAFWGGNFEGFAYTTNDGFADYYDDGILVYRRFIQVYDEYRFVWYNLFYDEYGNLIYANITHYRGASYFIHFHNDDLLHVKVGPFSSSKEAPFIDGGLQHAKGIIEEHPYFVFVLEDLAVCLENAYKQRPMQSNIRSVETSVYAIYPSTITETVEADTGEFAEFLRITDLRNFITQTSTVITTFGI